MEIKDYILKRKKFLNYFLDFLDETVNADEKYQLLIDWTKNQDFTKSLEETFDIFRMISNVIQNHHRTHNFYIKIARILKLLIKDQNLPISDEKIIKIFENNKTILLYLFEKQIIIPTKLIENLFFEKKKI